jgi:hypothetical protein
LHPPLQGPFLGDLICLISEKYTLYRVNMMAEFLHVALLFFSLSISIAGQVKLQLSPA